MRGPPPTRSSPNYPDHMRRPMQPNGPQGPRNGPSNPANSQTTGPLAHSSGQAATYNHFQRLSRGEVDESRTTAEGYEERDEAGDDGDMSKGCMAGICGGCAALLTLLILLLCSFQGLHATEYGLIRNKMSGVVAFDEVYQGGRNFIGFWNEYLVFPSTIESIEWLESTPMTSDQSTDLSPMNVRTSDGLTMRLGVVVQYQVVGEHIPDMYKIYKMKYENFFTSNLRSSLQVLIAEYKSEDLWLERKHLAQQMKETCDAVCAVRMEGMLTCWGVQLLANHLDPKIEARIVDRQVEVQKQQFERAVQKTELVRAETLVLKAEYELQIGVVQANATAFAKRIVSLSRADATLNTAASKKTAMQTVQNTVQSLGAVMSADLVVDYMEKTAIIENKDGQMFYGDFQQNNEL